MHRTAGTERTGNAEMKVPVNGRVAIEARLRRFLTKEKPGFRGRNGPSLASLCKTSSPPRRISETYARRRPAAGGKISHRANI